MTENNLWITRIELKGNFWDTTLYSGLLYLWQSPRKLSLYHWNKWQDTIPLHELPIYLSPVPVQMLPLTIGDLHPYFYKEIHLEKDVRDFFVYHHQLFFLDEDGLFSMEPESAHPQRVQLAKGNFHSFSLSGRNRLVLWGPEGVYEYQLSRLYRFPAGQPSQPLLHQWSKAPVHHAEWLGQDLILYDFERRPFQHYRFLVEQGKLYLIEKRPIENDVLYPAAYNEDLSLYPSERGHEWGSLFSYPPVMSKHESVSPALNGIALEEVPNPHFPHPPLDEKRLFVAENSEELQVRLGHKSLLHFNRLSYRKWRVFSKSRLYQHHLHLLHDGSLSMLLFFQKKE